MSNTTKHIDELVRERLEGHSISPQGSSWERLNEALQKDRKIALPWYYNRRKALLGILLLSLFSFGGGYFLASLNKQFLSNDQKPLEGETQLVSEKSLKPSNTSAALPSNTVEKAGIVESAPEISSTENGQQPPLDNGNTTSLAAVAPYNSSATPAGLKKESVLKSLHYNSTVALADNYPLGNLSALQSAPRLLGFLKLNGFPQSDFVLAEETINNNISLFAAYQPTRSQSHFSNVADQFKAKSIKDAFRVSHMEYSELQLQLAYKLGSKWNFRTGVTYGWGSAKMVDQYLFVREASSPPNAIIFNDNQNEAMISQRSDYQLSQWAIPVMLEYQMTETALKPYVAAGVELTDFNAHQLSNEISREEDKEAVSQLLEAQPAFANSERPTIGVRAELGLQWQFSKKLSADMGYTLSGRQIPSSLAITNRKRMIQSNLRLGLRLNLFD